ncbi:MAG: hypothetical protein C4B59_08560 [Candidatus Methanogaster sp.]|uniref:Uncharacterized protein n=1 Tax=Candidatus Methanogaster sp. TaxID=3386292 RepID=A0AC61L2C2_9EURY|nr:MAG: hypothetical protein C4B59_08560 [ANME-2 cluster archaeon]
MIVWYIRYLRHISGGIDVNIGVGGEKVGVVTLVKLHGLVHYAVIEAPVQTSRSNNSPSDPDTTISLQKQS